MRQSRIVQIRKMMPPRPRRSDGNPDRQYHSTAWRIVDELLNDIALEEQRKCRTFK